MSLKTHMINSLQVFLAAYKSGLDKAVKASQNERLTEAGKRAEINDILEELQSFIADQIQAGREEYNNMVEAETIARDSRLNLLNRNKDYQTLLTNTIQQLPFMKGMGADQIQHRLAMFKDDPYALSALKMAAPGMIANFIPVDSFPDRIKKAEAARNGYEFIMNRFLSEISEYRPLQAYAHLDDTSINSRIQFAESSIAYWQGLSDNCMDFDISKVDLEAAAMARWSTAKYLEGEENDGNGNSTMEPDHSGSDGADAGNGGAE